MIDVRRMGLPVAALAAAACLGAGLAVAGGGLAQANKADPHAWGYALVEKPTGPVAANHWAESVPSPTPSAAALGPGLERVKFPNIGMLKGGVVHVTAIIDVAAWCQARTWGPLGGSEVVTVRCYRKGGVPAFAPFTISFSARSGSLPGGLTYAYVHDTTTGVAASYNSAGMANAVSHVSTGSWVVRLHGGGPAVPSGGVQVTAVNTSPVICDVGGRSSTSSVQVVRVNCYTPGGVPKASGWTLSYQRGRAINGGVPARFGYTVYNKLVCPTLVPVPAPVNFNSAGGTNSISCAGGNLWLVRLPRLGALPNTVFVTPAAKVARICDLITVWGTTTAVLVRDVACWDTLGHPAKSEFFLSYTSH